METSSACARWRWEGGRSAGGNGVIRGNESNSKRGRRTTHRADGTAGGRRRAWCVPCRTVDRGREGGPRAPIAVELLDEADEVRRVHLVRGQRGRCRARRGRALVAEDHRRPVFAARRHARPARARRRRLPGEDMPPEFARADPRTSRRGRVGSLRRQPARACVRQRCAPPPTSAAMTAAASAARRVNNDEGGRTSVNARPIRRPIRCGYNCIDEI